MRFALVISLLAVTPAFAQQQSPSELALGAKLFQEINAGISCSATVIDLQRQLAEARKQIEELKKPKE